MSGFVGRPEKTAAVSEIVLPRRTHAARQIARRNQLGIDHAVLGQIIGALAEQQDQARFSPVLAFLEKRRDFGESQLIG
jgi:hypothetical protein